MRVRATLRLQNEKMIAAREGLGLTLKVLSERAGVQIGEICQLQRFDYTIPKAEEKAIRLSAVLGIAVDDIVPFEALGQKIESTFVRTFDADALDLADLRDGRNVLPDAGEAVEQQEIKDLLRSKMQQVLSTLTYREREVLNLRYGIGGDGRTHTLEETAKVFRVTRERLRQIEAKAIRKLQHPCRAKRLEAFLPNA